MNQCEAAPPAGDPRRQFTDAGVPIIHVMSQSDYLGGIDARRPDSDTPIETQKNFTGTRLFMSCRMLLFPTPGSPATPTLERENMAEESRSIRALRPTK